MFKISYRITEEEFIGAVFAKYRATQSKRVKLWSCLFALPMACYLIYQIYSGGSPVLYLVVLLVALVPMFIPRSYEKSLRSAYHSRFVQRNDTGKNILVVGNDSGLATKVEDVGSTELNWCAFIKAIIVEQGVLLYQTASSFYWLPKNAFGDLVLYDEMLGLVKDKVETVVDTVNK